MREVSPRAAARAAYVAAGLNLLAALAIATLLQPGLPGPAGIIESRFAYVRDHAGLWWIGWLAWHAAGIGLLGFYVALAGVWRRRAPIRCGLAVLCGCAGLAADLIGQALYLGLPSRMSLEGFAILELAVLLLTGYVANGLYTIGGVLIAWAGAAELPRGLLALSAPVWIGGATLAVASVLQSPLGQILSTAVLMPSLVLWIALVGRWLQRCAS